MSDEPKAVAYTGNDDDEVVVATTTESRSLWDRIENMQAAEITVGEVKALRAEIERLRSLITAWADADDVVERDYQFRDWDALEYGGDQRELSKARDALRKAVGR